MTRLVFSKGNILSSDAQDGCLPTLSWQNAGLVVGPLTPSFCLSVHQPSVCNTFVELSLCNL